MRRVKIEFAPAGSELHTASERRSSFDCCKSFHGGEQHSFNSEPFTFIYSRSPFSFASSAAAPAARSAFVRASSVCLVSFSTHLPFDFVPSFASLPNDASEESSFDWKALPHRMNVSRARTAPIERRRKKAQTDCNDDAIAIA